MKKKLPLNKSFLMLLLFTFCKQLSVLAGDLSLSFSSQLMNSYHLEHREIEVLLSVKFNGSYDYNTVTSPDIWENITDRFIYPVTSNDLKPTGEIDISDLVGEGESFYIAFRYKTTGTPPSSRLERGWRVESFSVKQSNSYGIKELANHSSVCWQIVSAGNVKAGRGASIQSNRLGFLANNEDMEGVGLDEWVVSAPLEYTKHYLNFSSRVMNSHPIDPREITVHVSTAFKGPYNFDDVKSEESDWKDISDRFTWATVNDGALKPAGNVDISDLIKNDQPFYIAFKYKTNGLYGDKTGRQWRIEEFSVKRKKLTEEIILASQADPGWEIVSAGGVDPSRGLSIQSVRLNFLANNVNRNVGIEEWAVSKVINLSVYAQAYYIDSDGGNDFNDGLSESTAWKTLNAVNSKSFGPGAKLLFKSGGIWIGQLRPGGSGTAIKPIVIDKYGAGEKPLINANGELGAVLSLKNQSFWEINNLELTNDAAEAGERNGVDISAEEFGLIQHIHLKNLDIHHIKGISNNGARTAGIYFRTISDDIKDTRFDNILIEGCKIHHVQNQGIHFRTPGERNAGYNHPSTADWERRRFSNVIIRNNIIHHISKNAILLRTIDGGVVERNLCYETALDTTGNTIFTYGAKGTVFQYNEGYLNRSPGGDGSLYDADLGSPETVWQYSYSHDNAHGLMWLIPDERDENIIVRYNISQNDKGYLLRVNYPFVSAYIYNNTFYIPEHLSPSIIQESTSNYLRTYHFYNNIVYNLSPTASYNFSIGTNTTRFFSNNIFYGHHPANEPEDPFKITSDPLFVAPGTATIGLHTVGGYKLKPGSPALGAGKLIANNGGRDYFGLPVSDTTPPNIGFYNGEGTTVGNPDNNFHLYLLIGQSNMAGRGPITPEYATMNHPRVKMLNANNEWVTAKHPLHFDASTAGVGPGLEFAIRMAEANPDITIGLIPSAVGATGIDMWQPGGYDSSKDVYPYDDALLRAKRGMLEGVMKGILWHQGEGNSTENSSGPWIGKVKTLITRLRTEFGDYKLPFILGELSYERPTSHFINDKLPQLISEVPYTAIASASGLSAFDVTHFDSPSATILGERYALQMQAVQQLIANTLPVELDYFKAFRTDDTVELSWMTLSEKNNAFFEPERSTDGKTFLRLGRVEGNGDTNRKNTYQFYDDKPLSGINYYRLKQTDHNGEFTYSFPVSVNFSLSDNLSKYITVYPNPGNDVVFIKPLKLNNYKALRLVIVNSEGKKCGEKIIYSEEEMNYDVSSLNAGLYFIELVDLSGEKSFGKTKFIRN